VDSEGLLPARNRFLSHRIRETLLVGAFVAMVILFATQRADIFLSSQNVYNLINGIPVFGLLAIGVTVVLTLGEFDLSVTSVASLSSIIVAVLVTQGGLDLGFGLALSVIIALAAGAFLGAVSGVAVGYFGANAFIVTLAVGSVASGFELLIQGKISGGQTSIALANLPRTLLKLSSDHLFGFEVAVPIFLVIAIVIGLILALTPWGRHVQAIGGNETAARVAGVAVRRTKLVAFTLTGVLAAFAGVFFVARNGYY
jgi:ribose transport system permease protein